MDAVGGRRSSNETRMFSGKTLSDLVLEIENDAGTSNHIAIECLCRLCLNINDNNESYDIYSTVWCEENGDSEEKSIKCMIEHVTGLMLEENDLLPHRICKKCLDIAWNSFLFKTQAVDANSMLQQYLERLAMTPNQTKSVEMEVSTDANDVVFDVSLDVQQLDQEWLNMEAEAALRSSCDDEEQIDKPSPRTETDQGSKTQKPAAVESITRSSPDAVSENECRYCTKCGDMFENGTQLKLHLKQEHKASRDGERHFVCGFCKRSFSLAQTLSRHAKVHQTLSKNKQCSYCGKCFNRTDDLGRHIRIHTGEKPYVCEKCPKSFKQISELKEHQKSHSNEKNYVCNECGKCLQSRNGLYVHMKAHRGEKNHECCICGTKYATFHQLKSHISHIHSSDKLFPCTHPGCDKSFVAKGPLLSHMAIHTGRRKLHKCDICGNHLSTATILKQHKLSHAQSSQSIECSVCSETFSSAELLQTHQAEHTDTSRSPKIQLSITNDDQIAIFE